LTCVYHEGAWGLHSMKANRALQAQLHSVLTSAQDVGWWQTSRSGSFSPGKDPWYPINQFE